MRAHDGMLGDDTPDPLAAPLSRMRSSRVFDTSASAELFTARRPSSSRCIPGESASYAAYMFANSVSPPYGGTSRATQHRRHRRALEVHGVAVPDAAEVHRLVRELRDRDDLGEAVDALHERVLDRFADATGEREERLGLEDLVAEEHDEMRQPGAPDLGDGLVDDIGREVDSADLGADRAGDGQHLDARKESSVIIFDQGVVGGRRSATGGEVRITLAMNESGVIIATSPPNGNGRCCPTTSTTPWRWSPSSTRPPTPGRSSSTSRPRSNRRSRTPPASSARSAPRSKASRWSAATRCRARPTLMIRSPPPSSAFPAGTCRTG